MKDRVVALVDAHNYIQMIGPGETLEIERSGQYKQFGEYISVFPYGGIATGVTMKGFKYPLDRATVTGFNTLTVSNEIVEDVAQISINQGYLIICETRD